MFRIAMEKLTGKLREEGGQALLVVLAFLLVGSLTLPPVLAHIGTSLKTGEVYEEKAQELYAADSGIEDAIWEVKYDRLSVLFDDPEYDIYDYDSTWSYTLDEAINGESVNITVENVWIPKDVPHLSAAESRAIIESNKLMVAGTAPGGTSYQIKINFYPGEEEEDALMIESLGIWLPLGFTYATGSSNLEEDDDEPYYSVPSVEDYAGGQAVVWDFASVPYADFPGVVPEEEPMMSDITFEFEPDEAGEIPVAIAWMVTSGVSDVPLSWDIDTRMYRIVSAAGDTEIEARVAKCELRKMGAAIAGDYRAIGNSLMTDDWDDYFEIRDYLHDDSSAEVSDIPGGADVIAAYLYWSGWFDSPEAGEAYWEDDCGDFDDWDNESYWSAGSGYFVGHDEDGRYLTMADCMDLSSHELGSLVITWEQWEDGDLNSHDELEYQYSTDNGSSWSGSYLAFEDDIGDEPVSYVTDPLPDECITSGQFKFRFRLDDFNSGGQFCYVDNFAICEMEYPQDLDVTFAINDYYGVLTAGEYQTLENQPGQYSYACRRDVTQIVKEHSNLGDGENRTGNGIYTTGGVEADTDEHWSYAGWSLIIVYSSPETAGHQLYLYDTFAWAHEYENLDFDFDGEPGGSITGFYVPDKIEGEVNAATLTCFVAEGDNWISGDQLVFNDVALSDGYGTNNVWNGASIGMTQDGMDIDTFYVTWGSHLLEPGDTTAQLDLPTGLDNWNLIYIILSLRSETVTGGTTHYIIRNN
jgi:hypothetical protein